MTPLPAPLPPDSPSPSLMDLLFVTVLRFAVAWLVCATLAAAGLALTAPLTPQDLRWASWAPGYPDFDHPTRVLNGLLLVGGLAVVFTRRRLREMLVWGLFVLVLQMASSPGTAIRIGLLTGEARVGCFDYSSPECVTRLGLPKRTPPTRLAKIQKQRSRPRPTEAPSTAGLLPGAAFLASPLFIREAPALPGLLALQRAEVIRLRLQLGGKS